MGIMATGKLQRSAWAWYEKHDIELAGAPMDDFYRLYLQAMADEGVKALHRTKLWEFLRSRGVTVTQNPATQEWEVIPHQGFAELIAQFGDDYLDNPFFNPPQPDSV